MLVMLHPRRQNRISSTLSWNQNIGPERATNRRKFVEIVGSDSGSRVVNNKGAPLESRSFTLGLLSKPGRVEDSSTCGRRENVAFVGDVKFREEAAGDDDGAGDGDDAGRAVNVRFTGCIEAGLFRRRVAVGGIET